MKLREIAASFIQPEMEDIMTLQQKKERAIRLKLISALSLCLFFLLWYLVTDVLKLAPATLFPSPVTALKTGIAKWNSPRGGYFISAELLPGTAKRTVALCKEAGLTMTGAGSVYPYGRDPEDSVLRIAPTFAPAADLPAAMELFSISARLAAAEKLLSEKI